MPKVRKSSAERGTVRTDAWRKSLTDRARVGELFVVPRSFMVHADLTSGAVVDIAVEVNEGKARARTVTVTTDNPGGVSWTMLANVPTRDIVATGCLDALRKERFELPEGYEADVENPIAMALLASPSKKDADEVRDAVQALVGWTPKTEGLEVQR